MRHPPNLKHAGIEYDLSHLQQSQVTVTLASHNKNPEIELLLDVRFSNHCYSEGDPKTAGHPHDLLDHNNKPRWFCPDRHRMSLQLPDIIQALHTKKCLFTGKNNWLVVESQNALGTTVNYHVYFNLKKHREIENSLIMYVESAYEKTKGNNAPKRGRGHDRIGFPMLARKTLADKSIKRPPRGR
jgi:hypothetical protein